MRNPYIVTCGLCGLAEDERAIFGDFKVEHVEGEGSQSLLTNKNNVKLAFWRNRNGTWMCAVNDSGTFELTNFQFAPEQNGYVDATWTVGLNWRDPSYDHIRLTSDVAARFQQWVENELAIFGDFKVEHGRRSQTGTLTNKNNVKLAFWLTMNAEWTCAVNESGLFELRYFKFVQDQNGYVDVTWDIHEKIGGPSYNHIKLTYDVAEKFQKWVKKCPIPSR